MNQDFLSDLSRHLDRY